MITLNARYGNLTASQQILYRTLGVLPAPGVDPDLAAAAAALPPDEAGQALAALTDGRLLESLNPGPRRPRRFRLLPKKREHTRTPGRDQDGNTAQQAALLRLYEWMLAHALAAQQQLTQERGIRRRDVPFRPTTGPSIGIPFTGAERGAPAAPTIRCRPGRVPRNTHR